MDYDGVDFDWGLNPRTAKSKVAAQAKLREIFDPNYEPWEKVHDVSDQSDLEGVEVNNSCDGSTFWFPNDNHEFLVGESSRSSTKMEACEAMVLDTVRAKSEGHFNMVFPSCVASSDSEAVIIVNERVEGTS